MFHLHIHYNAFKYFGAPRGLYEMSPEEPKDEDIDLASMTNAYIDYWSKFWSMWSPPQLKT